MQIRDIMTPSVETVRPDDSLQAAAVRMKTLDVGILPVFDGEQVVGVLTDRDITVNATADGTQPTETAVKDVMTPDVIYCFEDQPVETAAALMEEKKIRRLVVLNREKRLAGMLSIGDIANRTGDSIATGQVIEKVSEPAKPHRRRTKVPDTPSETKL
jgi:CBS domain-containing protein